MAQFFTQLTSVIVLLLLQPTYTNAGTALDTYGPATAFTGRYWDCCKPSCAWTDHGNFKDMLPIQACDIDNKPQMDVQAGTGCNGGASFSCATNAPWAVNDTFSYGFVGAHMKGNVEQDWCCGCYEIKFTTGTVKGKTMVVQAHNTNYDAPESNVFNFAIPGGNTSYAGACAIQYNVPNSTFGIEDIGLEKLDECDNLPKELQAGCRWRFDWFNDAQAPMIEYKRVTCPKALTDITGCVRTDEESFLVDAAKAGNSTSGAAATVAVVGSFPLVLSWAIGALVASSVLFI